jgi:hypothetical protein
VRERIVELRLQMTKDGLDAPCHDRLAVGTRRPPTTIGFHDPARVLHAAALIVPEPRKRPRSSYHRFAAAQPNGRNAFEYLIAVLGITQKNGNPGRPQTQGKIERFHQTSNAGSLNSHQQPPCATCKHSLTASRRSTTSNGHTANSPATPQPAHISHYREPPRPATDNPATTGSATTCSTPSARCASAEPAACTTSASAPPTRANAILAIADNTTVTVIELHTGEVLATNTIDPTKTYWRSTQRAPGRWPEPPC